MACYWCSVCRISLSGELELQEHTNSAEHIRRIQKRQARSPLRSPIPAEEELLAQEFEFCVSCCVRVPVGDVSLHKLTVGHGLAARGLGVNLDSNQFTAAERRTDGDSRSHEGRSRAQKMKCRTCSCCFTSFKNAEDHFNSKRHRENYDALRELGRGTTTKLSGHRISKPKNTKSSLSSLGFVASKSVLIGAKE